MMALHHMRKLYPEDIFACVVMLHSQMSVEISRTRARESFRPALIIIPFWRSSFICFHCVIVRSSLFTARGFRETLCSRYRKEQTILSEWNNLCLAVLFKTLISMELRRNCQSAVLSFSHTHCKNDFLTTSKSHI